MDSLLLSVLLIHLSLFPQQPPIYQRVPEKRKGPQFFSNHGSQLIRGETLSGPT